MPVVARRPLPFRPARRSSLHPVTLPAVPVRLRLVETTPAPPAPKRRERSPLGAVFAIATAALLAAEVLTRLSP